jgi:4-amino-4-deoxy-L-arabinose transferase-like glycosyltransferase
MNARWGSFALLALALLGFSADVLDRSAHQLSPRYDEVSYLALARDYAHEGGFVPTIRCHLEARCKEDNRPPLYELMIAAVIDDSPAAYARAKLVSYGTALLLLAMVFVVVRRLFSPTVALGSVVALALMPALSDFSSHVQHDTLYAAITFAAIFAMASWQARGVGWWLLTGALVGLAFLTKGSGHLLFLPLLGVSFYTHRWSLWRKPILYAAACGFVAVSFFLLVRNIKLAGSPFFNVNGRGIWLDKWQDVWALQLDPEWKRVGLGWYLERHSMLQLVLKVLRGLGLTIGVSVYAAGIGFATPALRALAGVCVLVVAGFGVRRRWQDGHKVEVLAVLSTWMLFAAALSLATSGGPGPQARYCFPYVTLLVPYFVAEVVERLWPWLEARAMPRILQKRTGMPSAHTGLALVALLLATRFAFAAPALRHDPLSLYAVEPNWHRTSLWLGQHLAAGESFALPYQSLYSTWDVPRPQTDTRWNFWYGMPEAELRRYLDGSHIQHLLVDTAAAGFAEYATKLSASKDGHGPLAFLDWPRCFADDAQPSRFLVFCRPL